MRFLNSKLKIENTILQNIAKKYGTPAYCYSYKQLRENINDFKKNFKSISPLICFAIKSNTNLNLIKEIKKFGLGADVVSKGEMMMALKAGIDPNKIVFSGVGMTNEEINFDSASSNLFDSIKLEISSAVCEKIILKTIMKIMIVYLVIFKPSN